MFPTSPVATYAPPEEIEAQTLTRVVIENQPFAELEDPFELNGITVVVAVGAPEELTESHLGWHVVDVNGTPIEYGEDGLNSIEGIWNDVSTTVAVQVRKSTTRGLGRAIKAWGKSTVSKTKKLSKKIAEKTGDLVDDIKEKVDGEHDGEKSERGRSRSSRRSSAASEKSERGRSGSLRAADFSIGSSAGRGRSGSIGSRSIHSELTSEKNVDVYGMSPKSQAAAKKKMDKEMKKQEKLYKKLEKDMEKQEKKAAKAAKKEEKERRKSVAEAMGTYFKFYSSNFEIYASMSPLDFMVRFNNHHIILCLKK